MGKLKVKPRKPKTRTNNLPPSFTMRVTAVWSPVGVVGEADLALEPEDCPGDAVDVLRLARDDWAGVWPPRVGQKVRVIPARVEPLEDDRG